MAEETPVQYFSCEEALEPIETGRRTGCCSYIWRNQYVYKKNSEYDASNGLVFYMKCWESGCKATMVCRAVTLVPVSSTPHNHPPQVNEVLKLRFKYEVIGRLRANPQESSSQIYDKLAADPRFKAVAKLMRRRRTTSMMSRIKQTLKVYKIKKITKKKPKTRIRTRYALANQSEKTANIQINEGDMIQDNLDGMLQKNVDNKGNEDSMLKENEDDMLQEKEDDQTITIEEDNESNIILPTKCPSVSNDKRVHNDQLNSDNTSNSITSASEPIFSPNKNSDVGELKNVVYKLEEISKRLYAVTLADTYEQFGKYIGTLLRGLPIERAKRIMENTVSEVLSAKLGFEVRVQPAEGESIFAEPLPECFEYDSTGTRIEMTAENDVEVFPCQAEEKTTVNADIHKKSSTTSNKDQQASNTPPLELSLSGCSESGIPIYTAMLLKDSNNQRVKTVFEKTDSYKPATKQRKTNNASKDNHNMASASPSSRLSEHFTEPSVDNERLICCISTVESVGEKTAQTLFKEAPPNSSSSEYSTVPFVKSERLMVSNGEDLHSAETEMTYQEVNTYNLRKPSRHSCAEHVVECSSESLMSYVMVGEDKSLSSAYSEAKDVLFICTCRNISFYSSCDLRKHFSSMHPGQAPSFKVKELSNEETSDNSIFQRHFP